MTQERLAEASGVARVTLARAELDSDPRVSTALRLAHALGVSVEQVWGDEAETALRAAERVRSRRR